MSPLLIETIDALLTPYDYDIIEPFPSDESDDLIIKLLNEIDAELRAAKH